RWLSRAMTSALAAKAHALLEHVEAEEGSDGGGDGQLGEALHVGRTGPNRPAPRERGAGGTTIPTTTNNNNNTFCKLGNNGTAALSLPAGSPAEDPLEVYDGHLTSRHHYPGLRASMEAGSDLPLRGSQSGGAPQRADSAEAAPGETQPVQRPLQTETETDVPSPAAAAAAAMEMHKGEGAKGFGRSLSGNGKRKFSPRLGFKDRKDDEDDGDDDDGNGDGDGDGDNGGSSQKKDGNHRHNHDKGGDDYDDGGDDGWGARGDSVGAPLPIGRRAVRIQSGPAPGRRRGDVEGRVLRFADTTPGGSPRRRVGSPPQRRSSA
ncbi:hypothetical protein VaNZ11_005488, partial [Volvox africanus]